MTSFRIALISSLAALAIACSGSQKAPENTAGAEDPSGSDGDTTTDNSTGDDSVSNQPGDDGCATEIAIKCEPPFVDGCDVQHPTDPSRKLTTEHRCVSAEPSGTPCEAEIALECGDNAQDSCLFDPPIGDVHFCAAK